MTCRFAVVAAVVRGVVHRVVRPLIFPLPIVFVVARRVGPVVCMLSPISRWRFLAAASATCGPFRRGNGVLSFLFLADFAPAIRPPAIEWELVWVKRVVGVDITLLSENKIAQASIKVEM